MDFLKAEIERKRKQAEQSKKIVPVASGATEGKKWLTRGEIEQMQLQQQQQVRTKHA
jgi:hypothetical protein